MHFEIKKDSLFKALSLIEKVAGKNPSLPVLDCILIEAGKVVTLSATNLEIGARVMIPAKITEKGKVAVPAGIFFKVVMNSSGDSLVIEEKNTSLAVSSGREHSVLKLHPTEDFPSIPGVEGGKTVNLHAQELIKGIKSVWYSALSASHKDEVAAMVTRILKLPPKKRLDDEYDAIAIGLTHLAMHR